MSDALTHVAIGDIIAKALAKSGNPYLNQPLVASILGFFSHAVLDKLDNDYTIDATTVDTILKDADFLTLQIGGVGYKLYEILVKEDDEQTKIMRLAAILGAVSPDIIDGVYSLCNPEKWQKGELLMPFHRGGSRTPRQTKEQSMAKSGMIGLLSFKIRF